MYRLAMLCVSTFLIASIATAAGSGCGNNDCCNKMGGIQYCDSSAGRYVCNNGEYSSCYCKRKAVMDIQALEGCCMWKGGVLKFDYEDGLMICNDGGVSEICSLGHVEETVAAE